MAKKQRRPRYNASPRRLTKVKKFLKEGVAAKDPKVLDLVDELSKYARKPNGNGIPLGKIIRVIVDWL